MTLPTLLLFVFASAVTIATPGPTVLLALNNGSRHGVRKACWGMAGALAADILLIVTVAAGLGAVIAASEVAFEAIKWFGAAYLAYVGWKMLRAGKAPDTVPDVPADSAAASLPAAARGGALCSRSFLVAATNPKALLFISAFLPQFIDTGAPLLPQYAILTLTQCLLNLAVMLVYAVLGARIVHAFRGDGMRWLNRLSGGTLIALAGGLAFYRRAQA
ncbi:lysine transporter LysE [Cupriavidus basilensis OR16]|uniref:Lysine transporter LysE n=1 Tax=Cupriavidus basilensis OR16 TaxID=1127483 RepID=H1S792_9BURK|nr:LysE family translocator [Cupriavidus basilensis]EHP41617.1 lysine transporter LysE [Cupriavidus basilensis OR16]